MVREPVMYPTLHRWFVALAALDVLLTWRIVLQLGGVEVNPIARGVIEAGSVTGMAFFKFATVAFVLIACEMIGRHSNSTGRNLALCAVTMNSIAVMTGLAQVVAVALGLFVIAT